MRTSGYDENEEVGPEDKIILEDEDKDDKGGVGGCFDEQSWIR